MVNMLILSICIPFYNRFDRLKLTLDEIKRATSDDFELVIIDNGSTPTEYENVNLNDNRIRLVKRDVLVSGAYNTNTCVSFARGTYTLLLLDKDYINGSYLDDFIKCLKLNDDIMGGYCVGAQWVYENKIENLHLPPKIFKEDALQYFCYRSAHPSGLFYQTKHAQEIITNCNQRQLEHPFFYDILLTDCAAYGPMMEYNQPVITTTDKKEWGKLVSESYSPTKRKLYFLPDQRLQHFVDYCEHLSTLHCSEYNYQLVIERLYKRTLAYVTTVYKNLLSDDSFCRHYGIKTKNVSILEMFYWWSKFQSKFLRIPLMISIQQKIEIVLKVHMRFLLKKSKWLKRLDSML